MGSEYLAEVLKLAKDEQFIDFKRFKVDGDDINVYKEGIEENS